MVSIQDLVAATAASVEAADRSVSTTRRAVDHAEAAAAAFTALGAVGRATQARELVAELETSGAALITAHALLETAQSQALALVGAETVPLAALKEKIARDPVSGLREIKAIRDGVIIDLFP